MRKLQCILLLFVLITLMMGCIHRVDRRLVLADTLMWTAPDSSLAILNTINRDSLPNDESRAYHALLLTQAQFRIYYNIHSDSLINSAVDYYSDNHNREHYTRALLYKGGYYEVHGNPVEAMRSYKLSEDNADSTDYRNLAQVNFRMGQLYYSYYETEKHDLEKFQNALKYYQKLEDKKMSINALIKMGNLYVTTDKNNARFCYDKAEELAYSINDSSNIYSVLVNRALLSIYDSLYLEAKGYMLRAFSVSPESSDNSDLYMLSQIYAKLGVLDSAYYFLNMPDSSTNDAYDKLIRYRCLADISIAKNNLNNALLYETYYKKLSDSLEHNKEKYSLLHSEKLFERNQVATMDKKISSLGKTLIILLFVLLLVAIVLAALYFRNKKDRKKLIHEIQAENFSRYENLTNDLINIDNTFSQTMQTQLMALNNIMSSGYNENNDNLDYSVTHTVIPINDNNDDFWNGLNNYLNYRYNGIMDHLHDNYPQLTKSDLNFIGLMCCGFSDAAIAVCKSYRNTSAVRSRRNAIKNKMKLDEYLNNYLDRMMNMNQKNEES